MTCIISPTGELRFVWSDDLAALRELGPTSIKRASFVEPTDDGYWTADMGPSGGPVLGPYHTRAEALGAELKWLSDNKGL